MVSLGSRGRCFFTTPGTGEAAVTEVEAGEGTLLAAAVVVVAPGAAEAAAEPRPWAVELACCDDSFCPEEASRDVTAAAAAEDGSLPASQRNNVVLNENVFIHENVVHLLVVL